MIEIFICEDDAVQRKRFNHIIDDYLNREDEGEDVLPEMKIKISTANPYEIIDYVKKNRVSGLYFLDVDLNTNINGIEMANEIRKYDKTGDIVFVTTHSEKMPLTYKYKVTAMGYIEKDNVADIEEEFLKCVNLVYERHLSPRGKPPFYIKSSGKVISEDYENIMFFEKEQNTHYVTMYSTNGTHDFRGNINELERMDDCLIRCNLNTVVNIDNVVKINMIARKVYMIDGSFCSVSIRQTKVLVKAFEERRTHK